MIIKFSKVTVETARASHRVSRYSSRKIKDALHIEFKSVDDAVSNTVDYMKYKGKLT